MSEKVLSKINNDIFSYETNATGGGVFKMSRVMPTEIHHTEAGIGTNGYLLASTGNGWTWTDPATITAGTSLTLSDLTDVTITSLATNQILSYDGSNWVNTDLPASSSTLSDLTDVAIASLATNQILSYDGTNWVNSDQSILIVGTSIKSTLLGNNVNNTNAVSLGYYAGNTGQLDSTVAIGASSGRTNQKYASTAVGWSAGYNNQGQFCTAIGTKAGYENQGDFSTAIGYAAGYLGLSAHSIAIGHAAAFVPNTSLTNYIVINATGNNLEPASSNGFHVKPIRNAVSANKLLYDNTTGEITYQPDSGGGGSINHLTIEDSPGGIFIGQNTAANILSNNNVISIGNNAGNNVSTATTDRIAIGNSAGYTEQQTYSICIGTSAGQMGGSYSSVIMGYKAGMWWPGAWSVFIGEEAGYNGSSSQCIAIGYQAGQQGAGFRSIAIGYWAARLGQGNHSLYIGDEAGTQGNGKTGVIGIGQRAGNTYQDDYSIAIGTNAGWLYQKTRCVAIGVSAGRSNQGEYSVAIGCQAGNIDQAANSIVLNAQTDTDLNPANTGFFVKPIRNVASTTGDKLCYDSGTGEISYQSDSAFSPTLTSLSTGEILSYDGTDWVNNGNIKSLTGTVVSTNYDYIHVTTSQHVKASWDYTTSLSITNKHAGMITNGGLFISSSAPYEDVNGTKPILAAIGAQFGGTPTDLEVDFMVEGTSMLIGDTYIGPNGNLVLFGDILDNAGNTLLASGGIVFESSLMVLNEGSDPKTWSSGASGNVLQSQGYGRPPIWSNDLTVDTLNTDTISERTANAGITLSSVVKMTGIQSDYAGTAHKLCYNPTTGEVTYKEDTGGGQTISKGMVVQYKHTDYKKQVADENGVGWRAPDDDLETGFVVHIKPVSASSKILVRCNAHVGIAQHHDSCWWGARLYKKVGTAGAWTHISEADNTKTGDVVNNNYGTPVWFTDNMGAISGNNQINEFITHCSGEYMDTAGSTEDIYYTIFWKARLSQTGDRDLYLNRHALWGDNYRPLPISSWDAIEIWDDGDTFGGTSSSGSGGGVPVPTSSAQVSAMPDGNLLDLDFTKATISGTNVEIDGTVIGTLAGTSGTTGVTILQADGLTTTSQAHVNVTTQVSWTLQFTVEIYFKMNSTVNNQGVFSAWENSNNQGHVILQRKGTTQGFIFSTAGATTVNQLHDEQSTPGFDGTWGHLVYTHDSGQSLGLQKKVYINGELRTGISAIDTDQVFAGGIYNNFYVGATVGVDDTGEESIKLFRVFNRVLDEEEITNLYNHRDGASGEAITDLTNYVLASNNADGTETKWLNVVPAPTKVVSESTGLILPEGNILNNEFTKATISGTNVEIDGTVIGTTVGTGVDISQENGISTTTDSYVDLPMSTGFEWTTQFTIELYFKMPPSSEGGYYNGLFSSFYGSAQATGGLVQVNRRGSSNGIEFLTTIDSDLNNNTIYTTTNTAGFDGTWGHIILTHDSDQPAASQKQVYVNGVSITDGMTKEGSQASFVGTRDQYWIGRNGIGGTQYETGIENLKTLRIYNRILTVEEISTLYENRDNPIASSGEAITDLTNYVLASNNADGTETKWLNVVPAPTKVVSESTGLILPEGNILNNEFTKATISGTNVEIDGTVIGTTVGTGVDLTLENGISTTTSSYVALNPITWSPEFSIELYFKSTQPPGDMNAIFFSNKSTDKTHGQIAIDRERQHPGGRFSIIADDGAKHGLYEHESMAGFDGTFGHLICTYSVDGGMKMYSNGALVTPTGDWGNAPYYQNFAHGVEWPYNFIGARPYDNEEGLGTDNGLESVKTLRIYSRALSEAEIQTLYENKDLTTSSPLVTDVTNYALVSSNATGTETKWEPMGGMSSKPYAYFVNAAGGDPFGIFANQYNDILFTSSELSSGITLDSGGYNFTVDTSGVYKCTVSYRSDYHDEMTFVSIRDTSNNNIAYSQSLGSPNSGTAAFFLMAQLDTGVSYKVSIYKYHNGTWVLEGTGLGHQIVCLLNMM